MSPEASNRYENQESLYQLLSLSLYVASSFGKPPGPTLASNCALAVRAIGKHDELSPVAAEQRVSIRNTGMLRSSPVYEKGAIAEIFEFETYSSSVREALSLDSYGATDIQSRPYTLSLLRVFLVHG